MGYLPVPATAGTGVPSRKPAGSRLLWAGSFCLWLTGQWPPEEVRVVGQPGRRLAVLGPCFAPTRALEVALAHSSSRAPDATFVSWAGRYHVILQDSGGIAVSTDLAGARPVHYAEAEAGTQVASAALPLAERTGAGVSGEWLASVLLCPSVPELVADRSPFASVAAVPAGHALVLGGGAARCPRVWAPSPGSRTLEEGAEALRTSLHAAVAGRVRQATRITADLSGGLDSSSMTFLAASALDPGGRLGAITVDEGIRATTT